jgi:ubiquinone/menaquinone biosynthesis C-methylase UbiE
MERGESGQAGAGVRDRPRPVGEPPDTRRLIPRLLEQYRENDAIWMAYHVLERAADRVGADRARRAFWRRATDRERARGLPGTNTRSANRVVWNTYDWSEGGEEWSVSEEWRDALIDEVMLPNLPADAVSLEIGPGAARWSRALQAASRKLILADVSERAIELCREKLGEHDNLVFQVTDGASLPQIGDSSVDFVWSFDVFVHIAPADQESYLREFARIMRPGGRGVVHHAGRGGVAPEAWRSSMTRERFAEAVEAAGMRLIEQRESWGENGQFAVPTSGDVITVFGR